MFDAARHQREACPQYIALLVEHAQREGTAQQEAGLLVDGRIEHFVQALHRVIGTHQPCPGELSIRLHYPRPSRACFDRTESAASSSPAAARLSVWPAEQAFPCH